jgi:hypothetical protein
MMSLVRSQVPDPSGALIPSNIATGSAILSGKGGETDTISVALASSVYNVRNATCGGVCSTCNGATEFGFNPAAYDMAVLAWLQGDAQVTWNTGTGYINPSGITFSSGNTSIVTINSGGGMQGQAPGTTSVSFSMDDSPIYELDCSNYPYCPFANIGGGAPTTVGQIPTSLKLVTAPPTILQQGNNNATNGCPLGNYGIEIDIDYQVLDQNGAPIASANMEPQENIPGVTTGYQDIGPSRISGTSTFTRADGTFDDAPVGKCPPVPVTTLTPFATQSIQILLNGTAYPVRTNSYSYSTTNLPNHGTVTNGKDINASQ